MAQMLIYDSVAPRNSEGQPVEMSLVNGVYRRSSPFRLSGLPQQLNYVGYEWLFSGRGTWSFLWFQEFWGDRGVSGSVGGTQPGARLGFEVDPAAPWGREQMELLDDATNQLKTTDLTRRIDVTITEPHGSTKWLWVGNWAPFARIALALNTAAGQLELPRVRVFAQLAGYEGKYFNNAQYPYGGENGA